jgi:CheY-like chemotaxis protein
MLERHDVSVLYVEDEPVAREELGRFLGRRVRDIRVATDGVEGLECFRERPADVVVTDVRMPRMDGLAMARQIRALSPSVLIVATTAHSDASSLLEAIDAQIDHYVVKPIAIERLVAALARCAELVGHRRAAEHHAAERERLIGELEAALEKVKRLRGLLPICASCKKIRDDRGYWQQLELYLRDHAEVEFSHSICPACSSELYPDLIGR